MRKILLFIWEIVKIAIIALIIVVPIRAFVFQPFFVRGASMEPSFHDYDYLIIDEISYRFSEPQKGDVIVFYNPDNTSQRFIKRVIGLPGETIKVADGKVFFKSDSEYLPVNEPSYFSSGVATPGAVEVTLGQDEYFVLGDNRSLSYDSRSFGAIKREYIIGKTAFRLWPLSIFAKQ